MGQGGLQLAGERVKAIVAGQYCAECGIHHVEAVPNLVEVSIVAPGRMEAVVTWKLMCPRCGWLPVRPAR